MKILFLNYEYPPIGGGAATATEAILSEMGKIPDLEVHLVTSGVHEYPEHLRIGGEVYVHRLPIGKDLTRLHSQSLRDIIVYSWKAFWFLRSFIRKEKPFDATIAFFTIPCGFLAWLVKVMARIPYVVSLRGADVPGFSEKYDRFYFFLKPLVRFLWRKAKAVIPNSVGICDLARKTAPNQAMEIIENGVDTHEFHPEREKKPHTKVIFVSTSRLTKRKGIDLLLKAFAGMGEEAVAKAELRLIGEGEEEAALRKEAQKLGIEEQVKFVGRVDHDHIASFYREADVFVLPSKNEGMSNAALEALASGLPLVVSGTGGMAEIVKPGVNGFLVNPWETEPFADHLRRFVLTPELIESFGRASRKEAEARSWRQTAEHFLESVRK